MRWGYSTRAPVDAAVDAACLQTARIQLAAIVAPVLALLRQLMGLLTLRSNLCSRYRMQVHTGVLKLREAGQARMRR